MYIMKRSNIKRIATTAKVQNNVVVVTNYKFLRYQINIFLEINGFDRKYSNSNTMVYANVARIVCTLTVRALRMRNVLKRC
jgi:hypothetical protein